MSKHKVSLELPGIEVGKVNATFVVVKDNKQLGKIAISKGGVEYYSGKKQTPIKMDWTKFDELMSGK